MEITSPRRGQDLVVFKSRHGTETCGSIRRLTPFQVVFELYAPEDVPAVSEALADCRVFLRDQVAFEGRAVVSSVVDLGHALLCAAQLGEPLTGEKSPAREGATRGTAQEFKTFLRATQCMFKVRPEFKLVIADMQTFLLDFQRWADQFALRNLYGLSEIERARLEREVIQGLQDSFLSFFGLMFMKFEEAAALVEPEAVPVHVAYAQRHLHPLLLCAPFMRRTFEKPLGHAGDHEMVNMMIRDPVEGETLFAKALNTFFLSTPPVVAHRNRVAYLKEVIEQETLRVLRQNRRIRIFNLGCGPAKEVQDFLRDSALSDRADFTLVDFSELAISSTGATLNRIRAEHGRNCSIQMIQKSVAQLLKEGAKCQPLLSHGQYDLVYCAGLFDYLSQPICARLVEIFYQAVAKDGSVLVTNVEKSNPSRKWMEWAVDWHLVYRNRTGMLDMVPEGVSPDCVSVETELSGVNIFLKLRKFNNA